MSSVISKSSSSGSNRPPTKKVTVIVGNTYNRISDSQAALDRTGRHKKIHDWTLYVDVINGNPDVIQQVEFHLHSSFRPNIFTSSSPVKTLVDGKEVWRFSTRQQCYRGNPTMIRIVGRGTTFLNINHDLSLKPGGVRSKPRPFFESKPLDPFKLTQIPDREFGLELELSSARSVPLDQIARIIRENARVRVNDSAGGWKLISDPSIQCSTGVPNCSKFELVSPVLRGAQGLNECRDVIMALDVADSISVNKSMGFHVHVSTEDLTVQELKKLCQNFVKYEDAIDSFMPLSRRTNRYCNSNKNSISGAYASNKERNDAIAACRDIYGLAHLMNPNGRYYKLNLQNLVNNRQPTVEFRQHSATKNFEKVHAWILFCVTMVHNSARFQPPRAMKNSRGAEEQFEALFQYAIKDRALYDFYLERRRRLASEIAICGSTCCDGCVSGHGCEAVKTYRHQVDSIR